MKLAIAGYGNLGKSLERMINADRNEELVAVFSRREQPTPLWAKFENAKDFVGKIDAVLLALGSYDDIERNVDYFCDFDTVDSFDTHAKIDGYKAHLNKIKPNTLSLCCLGWDPGVLSVARGIFSLGGGQIATFWGRGISQGHSHALRQIDGVIDAVQITAPKGDSLVNARKGEICPDNMRHCRLCYVACKPGQENAVAQKIVNMPNYFCGQEVKIEFCIVEKIAEIKKTTQHSGEVIACGEGYHADVKLDVQNNTEYTARIMLAYAKAIPDLKNDGYRGAMDPFDLPLRYVANKGLI